MGTSCPPCHQLHRPPRRNSPRRKIRRCCSPLPLRLVSVLFLRHIMAASATITIPSTSNDGSTVSYDSQPAMFGKAFSANMDYTAHLQHLPADPCLCDGSHQIDQESDREHNIRLEDWMMGKRHNGHDGGGGGEVVVPEDGKPVAILAKRGQCSFETKARAAMSLEPPLRPGESARTKRVVQYVIVYDDVDRLNLVPMSATDSGGIDVGMLFVSSKAGEALEHRILAQSQKLTEWGGTLITMDADAPFLPPSGMYDNPEQWMLAALAGVFMFLACFGCLMLCAQSGLIHRDGNVIMIGRRPEAFAAPGQHRRRGASSVPLLTEDQVMNLPEVEYRGEGVTALGLELNEQRQEGKENRASSSSGKKHGKKRRGKKTKSSEVVSSRLDDTVAAAAAAAPSFDAAALDSEEEATAPAAASALTDETTSVIERVVSVESSTPNTSCSVCLEEYENGEKLRVLPCSHTFHTDCIVPWLTQRQPNCPLCKFDVVLNPAGESSENSGGSTLGASDIEQGSTSSSAERGSSTRGAGRDDSDDDRVWSFWMQRRGLFAIRSEPAEEQEEGVNTLRSPLLRDPRSPPVASGSSGGVGATNGETR